MLKEKRILLIVGGGISAYKTPEIVRGLKARKAQVDLIVTGAGQKLVSTLTLETLAGRPACTDMFTMDNDGAIPHIALPRRADAVLIVPATADLLARMRAGMGDDLATAALLATEAPVLAAPAMNSRMWAHPATRDNVKTLTERGVSFIGPAEGELACGETGPGRMMPVEDILRALEDRLLREKEGPLSGKHVLVTSGPTQEALDPVRYITNRSSGKQGHAIAAAFAARGARVTLISGPVDQPDPPGVDTLHVDSAEAMMNACRKALPADVAICAAAVADWTPCEVSEAKLKKSDMPDNPRISLKPTADILASLTGEDSPRPALVIGFAAETHDTIRNAVRKRTNKGCDWILANTVTANAFGGETNSVTLISADRTEKWPEGPKTEIAERLAETVQNALFQPENKEGDTE